MSFFSRGVVEGLRLAEDEARMLGRAAVEPEHMLLAFCRAGRGRELLARWSVEPRDLHAAVLGIHGAGDELLLGRLPRSPRSRAVLERVVEVAASRGVAVPGDIEVLLALAADERAAAALRESGVDGFARLIEQERPSDRTSLDDAAIRRGLLDAAMNEHPPPLRPRVPAFERFSSEARRAIAAAAETAARLEHREVAPFHVLLGCLQIADSLAAQVLAGLWSEGSLGVVGEAIEQARMRGPHPETQATGRFSDRTRRLIAEDALAVAYRYRHQHITTGHLLLAVLDSEDRTTARLTHPHTQRLARGVLDRLPGSEHEAGPDHELEWLELQSLMRTLTSDIRRVLPREWTVRGSARGDIHLQVPNSQSESDYQIRPGWITGQRGGGRDRLHQVTQWMLEQLQTAVCQTTGAPWPTTADGSSAVAHAHVIPDPYNARLQLGYGTPDTPDLRVVRHDLLIHMLVRGV